MVIQVPTLEKIENKIPGYFGYANNAKRRSCDVLFRKELSSVFQQIEEQLHTKINSTISIKDHVLMNDLDSCMNEIRSLKSKIESIPYSDSKSSSTKQLKSTDLDSIYSLDLELINKVDSLSLHISESRSEIIHELIKSIDNAIIERTTFLNEF